MNKRILDGAALWKSDKLARIQPEWMRAEYANWIPLALANGVFEADTRRIWATVYSYNRPDISFDDAEEIKREFCRVGLLFFWPDEPTGKAWGFFVGIDKAGRLPPESRVKKKHVETGPTPPADALHQYVELTRAKPLEASMVSQWLANGCLGSGSGSGSGSGIGSGTHAPTPAPSAPGVCEQLLGFWNDNRGSLPEVLKLTKGRRDKILSRVKADPNFPQIFEAAVLKVIKTPFCCGGGERGWKATFDWFFQNDKNAVRVLEGAYDGGKGGSNGKPSASDLAMRNARALGLTDKPVN